MSAIRSRPLSIAIGAPLILVACITMPVWGFQAAPIQDPDFLRDGVTTREQVLTQLGTPFATIGAGELFVYVAMYRTDWIQSRQVIGVELVDEPLYAMRDTSGDYTSFVLLVEFDTLDRVSRHGIAAGDSDIESVVLEWLRGTRTTGS